MLPEMLQTAKAAPSQVCQSAGCAVTGMARKAATAPMISLSRPLPLAAHELKPPSAPRGCTSAGCNPARPARRLAGPNSVPVPSFSVLFGYLGIAFKFAEMDYVAKAPPTPFPFLSFLLCATAVDDLLEASKSISTLLLMVELDIQKDTVRTAGSHTRNLLRVKRGIDMVKVLFEKMLVTE
ncbi:Accelerated cell death 11, partial [Dichanthelium oligosanthes]